MHSFEPPSSHYVYTIYNIHEILGTPDLAHKGSMQNVPPLKSLRLWMLGTKGVCITRGCSLKQHLQKMKAVKRGSVIPYSKNTLSSFHSYSFHSYLFHDFSMTFPVILHAMPCLSFFQCLRSLRLPRGALLQEHRQVPRLEGVQVVK